MNNMKIINVCILIRLWFGNNALHFATMPLSYETFPYKFASPIAANKKILREATITSQRIDTRIMVKFRFESSLVNLLCKFVLSSFQKLGEHSEKYTIIKWRHWYETVIV